MLCAKTCQYNNISPPIQKPDVRQNAYLYMQILPHWHSCVASSRHKLYYTVSWTVQFFLMYGFLNINNKGKPKLYSVRSSARLLIDNGVQVAKPS